MLAGQMMTQALTITSIMKFADRVFPDVEVVSCTADNPLHRYTLADAFRRSRQLANALAAAGVQTGDRIATLAWNDYRHFELYYAVPCSGAVCHTINPRLFPEQVDYIINHAEDKLLFTDPAFLPLLEQSQGKLPKLTKIVVLTNAANMPQTSLSNIEDYESFIAGHSDHFNWPDIDENTASGLCYTSGTTGKPKGVLYSHRSCVLHSYAAALPDTMNLSSKDVILPIVPMFHVNAWSIPYCAAMVGAKIVFPGSKMGDGETLQRLISSEQVTISAGVPTIWLALLNYLRESGKTISSLERIVVGGAACPLSIIEEFQEKHGIYTHHSWGMTETSPLGVFNTLKSGMDALPKKELNQIRLKQGRPVFGVDLRIVADDGSIQPWDGESIGEVRIKGNWICSGYYKDKGITSHDEHGYLKTGDVACMDRQGYMRITDRRKDVIKSGGEWISSIELENAAVGHPAIFEAAVIGIPDLKWSERPLLIAVKLAGEIIDEKMLLSYLGGKVAKWWVPENVVFIDELPHTATGKISKKDLRSQFANYIPK
ncbi:long-chain fatty acid--CoA ligase [Zhongshania sp.]|jgi:acyl-CoA synthetase (AMP-forming)/AMP-acid ligase II|uniref:long-chain fatty acid--CoA ligase n=1 Tax=Zhongshania sp. TaxID=1971902 RepID=UPI0039E5D320